MRDAIASNDIEAMRRTGSDLQESLSRIGEAVYAGAGAGRSSGNGAAAGGRRARRAPTMVVDAEFKEV